MDKKELLDVLHHYTNTSIDEAQAVTSLRAQYPYSQLLQTLAARVSKDHGYQHQQRDLQVAAVYAADRALLKELIMQQPEIPDQQVVSRHVDADQQVVDTIDSADVADVVMDDLERLSKLKHTFENLFMDYPKTTEPERIERRETTEKTESQDTEKDEGGNVKATEEKPAEFKAVKEDKPKTSPVKSKKQRIIEMAKALNSSSTTAKESSSSKKKHRDGLANPADELIAEIQQSKEEITPESERQKQQIELINQFIRVQPSISNPRERGPSIAGDLSTIKSGEFGDNIVSETLVEILIKQGKKDKAIEVLKKLIWKYPQKKAYFASRIEELKK